VKDDKQLAATAKDVKAIADRLEFLMATQVERPIVSVVFQSGVEGPEGLATYLATTDKLALVRRGDTIIAAASDGRVWHYPWSHVRYMVP
jgi:hypothetical protein